MFRQKEATSNLKENNSMKETRLRIDKSGHLWGPVMINDRQLYDETKTRKSLCGMLDICL